jgi:hypothetical protein
MCRYVGDSVATIDPDGQIATLRDDHRDCRCDIKHQVAPIAGHVLFPRLILGIHIVKWRHCCTLDHVRFCRVD